VHACLGAASCTAFSTWGVGDRDSWILQFFSGWGYPLLFDTSYQPKPAFTALKSELASGCTP
jgi:endo-1,4-beta-xylanase